MWWKLNRYSLQQFSSFYHLIPDQNAPKFPQNASRRRKEQSILCSWSNINSQEELLIGIHVVGQINLNLNQCFKNQVIYISWFTWMEHYESHNSNWRAQSKIS